ncbi:hypothetical protein [Phaeodactylibacter luteus]|uniref:hypothetical protein n=1 Tax=Phaeodactylibacter luteus TaxID=1564516 RepID=UPI0014797D50|nr:hypothetical protein [Phaeodactylibacter luteus]
MGADTQGAAVRSAPVVKALCSVPSWAFIIGVKPDSHKHLYWHFDKSDDQGQVKWHTIE